MKKKFLLVLMTCILLVSTIGISAATWNSTYYMPGDVDNNGKLDARDITYIRRYIAGGYSVDLIDCVEADVVKDGILDVKDVIAIRRLVTGGYSVSL